MGVGERGRWEMGEGRWERRTWVPPKYN